MRGLVFGSPNPFFGNLGPCWEVEKGNFFVAERGHFDILLPTFVVPYPCPDTSLEVTLALLPAR